jgi:hypothetical protein
MLERSAARKTVDRVVHWLFQIQQEARAPGSGQLPVFLAASDLHGNVARLREILAVAEREQIEHVYLVGDLYAGRGGWWLYRLLQQRVPAPGGDDRLTLLWGNHELAFVAGMLGHDRQLRFFHAFGGEQLLAELNDERRQQGGEPLVLSNNRRLTAEDLALLRAQPELQKMARWIQQTHHLFATDDFGTGYLHAFPKINRHGNFVFEYRGTQGLAALPLIDEDLRAASRADHPVFSVLLRTETSPLWALFEITTARQFDRAARAWGVRQIVFGHRHYSEAVNVSQLNRQIGIAVDFDQGRGG